MANIYLPYKEIKKRYPQQVAIVSKKWKGKKKPSVLKWSLEWGIEIGTSKPLVQRISANVEATSQGWFGFAKIEKIPKEILNIEKGYVHD